MALSKYASSLLPIFSVVSWASGYSHLNRPFRTLCTTPLEESPPLLLLASLDAEPGLVGVAALVLDGGVGLDV